MSKDNIPSLSHLARRGLMPEQNSIRPSHLGQPNNTLSGMLSKDVKDILEGIYFFLTDALKEENLSGKGQCIRGGLILQLEALRQVYPTLHFPSATNSPPMPPPPYLEQTYNAAVDGSRLSTCSGGSSTNYSTGYSNNSSTGYSDGIPLPETKETSFIPNEEVYEEFDDDANTNIPLTSAGSHEKAKPTSVTRSDSKSSQGKLEDCEESIYRTNVELVSFRSLMVRCYHHGAITKRSKNFLRNSRFHGVLYNSLLYLYLKESDDQQKKVIDLSGYTIQESSLEDTRNSKRKNLAFELMGQGKKPHTFLCTSEKERNQWIDALSCVIRVPSLDFKSRTKVSDAIKPPIPPPPIDLKNTSTFFINESNDDEFYEDVNSESDPQEPNKSRLSGTSDYQVPDDDAVLKPQNVQHSFPLLVPNKYRPAPERPPLPDILKNQSRPLPEAPQESYYQPEGGSEIYCEINEESFSEEEPPESMAESANISLKASRSLSQDIFDTINERVSSPMYDNHSQKNNETLTEFPDDNLNYDIPQEATLVINCQPKKHEHIGPPPIPIKGVTFVPEDDDLEYKVPSAVLPQSIYQVPSSFPVVKEKVKSKQDMAAVGGNKSLPSRAENPTTTATTTITAPVSKTDASGELLKEETIPASSSVKNIISVLNRNEIERNSLGASKSKLSPKIKPTEKSFLQSQLGPKQNSEETKSVSPRSIFLSPERRKKIYLSPTQPSSKVDMKSSQDIFITKFAYVATTEGALSFNRGDEFLMKEAVPKSSWWRGSIRGKEGLIPKEYLRRKN